MWLYLGLTGNIACGKSTAADIFEKLGCFVLDADEISRTVMSKGHEAYEKIVKEFGSEILDSNEAIDRKALGRVIFNDTEKRKLLESIVHPAIMNEEKRLIGQIKSKKNNGIIITQAALTVETGSYKRFDGLIFVYTDEASQLERLKKRDGFDEDYAKTIIQSQMPQKEKAEYAQFIINNTKDLDHLGFEVKRVYNALKLYLYAEKNLK